MNTLKTCLFAAALTFFSLSLNSAIASKPVSYFNDELPSYYKVTFHIPDTWQVSHIKSGWYTFESQDATKRMHIKITQKFTSNLTTFKAISEWGIDLIRSELYPSINKEALNAVSHTMYSKDNQAITRHFAMNYPNGAKVQVTSLALVKASNGLFYSPNYLLLTSMEATDSKELSDPSFFEIIKSMQLID